MRKRIKTYLACSRTNRRELHMNFYTRYNEDRHRNEIEIDFLLSNESRTKMKVFPIELTSSHG